jgi:hypothetical protein
MDEPQSHRCRIIGLGSGARARYVIRSVRVGDPIDLRLMVDDLHDPFTVAAYHQARQIGYVAPGWRWVAHSIEQGDRHEAVVSTFETDARRNLTALIVEISILPKEPEAEHRFEPPPPGTAPWAPRIAPATRSRWPLLIPLGLLAGLAAGIWFLMERGFLPSLTQFAAGL